jgi:hypothetical protein
MQNEKRYFLVCCKCGHVGRDNFIRMVFPVRASDVHEAAVLGRLRPGVKHDHPDAVLWVREVEREDFLTARKELKADIYWQGARNHLALLADRLEPETRRQSLLDKSQLKADRTASRRFHARKNAIAEAEIHDYIAKEYRFVV